MKLVRQFFLKPTQLLEEMSILSNNLYNRTLYVVRHRFIDFGKLYSTKDLYARMKSEKDYLKLKKFGSQVPQQVLKQVLKAFKGFFNALKSWKKNPEKFKSKPNLPNYHKRGSKNIVVFTSQQSRLREGYIILPRKVMKMGFPKIKFLPPQKCRKFQSVRIKPFHDRFVFEIIYRHDCEDLLLDKSRKIGIDIGLNNFVAWTNNFDNVSKIVKGGILKSVNHYFNKKLAKYRSIAKKCNDTYETKRIKQLFRKRHCKMKDFFHKTSRKIVDYCIENDVGEIIVGYNSGWKQKVNLGKKNNQNFVSVPFDMFVKQLEYKGEMIGIKVRRITEEYTSQTCSSCGVVNKKNRKHRGLYVCKNCGSTMNVDVNASKNILRKAFPKSPRRWDKGALNAPVVLKV